MYLLCGWCPKDFMRLVVGARKYKELVCLSGWVDEWMPPSKQVFLSYEKDRRMEATSSLNGLGM